MNIDDIKKMKENCPGCQRHCPEDELSCPKGEAIFEAFESGDPEAAGFPDEEHSGREGFGRHGKGHGPHGECGHREGFGPRDGHGPHGDCGPREGFGSRAEHCGRDGFGPKEGFSAHEGFRPRDGFGPRGPMMPPFPMDDDSLAGLIRRCAFGMDRPGTRRSQERVLRMLASGEQMSQRHLQQLLRVKPGSMSELLGKLESKGYIERERDDDDRRKVSLKITETGLEYLKTCGEDSDDRFSALSAEEQETLKALLKKLVED